MFNLQIAPESESHDLHQQPNYDTKGVTYGRENTVVSFEH